MIKKIFIICHVFLPTNNARSNRTFELAKEFARLGNDVTIYAALGNYDYSKMEVEYNFKVKSIGELKIHNINSDGKIKRNLFKTILRYLFRPFFDFRELDLCFRTFQTIKRELKEQPIDLIISIAPPHSINWGVSLYKYLNRKRSRIGLWVADCGDPYMLNPFHKFKPPFYFKYVEKWFCRLVDYIIIPTEEGKNGYYKEFHSKIKVIPQGIDFSIAKNLNPSSENLVPTFIYSGALYKDKRDPKEFLDFLSSLDNIKFKFKIYTKQIELVNPYLETLSGKLEIHDYLSRDQLLQELSNSDFLVNIENIGGVQSPSKLIDYGLSKRPILSIDGQNIDKPKILQFLNGDYSNKYEIDNFERFNIRKVAEQFLRLGEF